MGKLELNKKKKKDALFSTAFELFTTKGLAKTTISDIVDKAGVAKGTFYLYFKDKYDIRNKLVAHKTTELFYDSHEALLQTDLTGFEEQLEFILEFILGKLEADRSLLIFISKNLSWGVFRGVFDEKLPDEDFRFYEVYLHLLEKSGRSFINPEMMLFTIIELVSATCYSCILYEQPASMEEYKPYLHKAIRGIIKSFEE
jgi:AcrR family transcriptional regulator